MIKLSVNGAAGRMGRSVIRLASEEPDIELVEALEFEGSPAIGEDAGAWAGVSQRGITIAAAQQAEADVMIDFSLPDGFRVRLKECVERGMPFVSGTTGLEDADQALLDEAAKTIPVLLAPNFSVGVTLLCRLVADAAKVLGDYDVEVVEMHHNRKKDAPSGTAERLVEVLRDALGRTQDDVTHGRHGIVGERKPREIGVHALRGGDVVGDHRVIFATGGERVELTHKASSRDTFARGAVRAARFLATKPAGRYTIEQVLFG